MRWIPLMIVLTLFAPVVLSAEDQAPAFRFSKAEVGKLPKGWKAEKTGKGEGSVWKVVADDTAPSKSGYVLAQTAAAPQRLFNLCVSEDSRYQDVEISVAFKAIEGKNDQGGGLVWRYQDPDNYYIARMNPLEDNFRAYKVVAGKRMQLATKEDLTVKAGEWHTIKIVQTDDHMECYLDGKRLLDVRDLTFPKAGKIGLWTKSDAQTRFDDLKVRGKRSE